MIATLDWISRITAAIFIMTIVCGWYLWVQGILPVLWRLGNGLAKRQLVIFAKADNFSSLRDLLVDSRLFSSRNIGHISSLDDIKKADNYTLFLVYWPDWKEDLKEIVAQKHDATALVIYAPQGKLTDEQLALLNDRNVMLANFRGRLLNDIVVSMVTTEYQRK